MSVFKTAYFHKLITLSSSSKRRMICHRRGSQINNQLHFCFLCLFNSSINFVSKPKPRSKSYALFAVVFSALGSPLVYHTSFSWGKQKNFQLAARQLSKFSWLRTNLMAQSVASFLYLNQAREDGKI